MLVAAVLPALALAFLREVHLMAGLFLKREWNLQLYTNLIVLLCSAGLVLASAELFLQISHSRKTAAAGNALTIPDEWEKKPAEVEGARYSFTWHGVLHVVDDRGLRRSTPFPKKKEGSCRIAVFGDSLTYGYGVAEERAYPSLIEGALSDRYRVEVLNLGVSGRQSGGVLAMMKEYVPLLEPDVVVYGVCLNDFLASGEGEGANRMSYAWSLPFPDWFKREMTARTLTAEVVGRGYDNLLRKAGLRMDFYSDILKNFDGYQVRFGEDVRKMNTFVKQRGLPPVVAMVLDQNPLHGGRGHRIARIAEDRMNAAGMNVVPTEEYYREHSGRAMSVSRWEGHPSEEAHQLFARRLAAHLEEEDALQRSGQ